jgi:hypothetical protein
LRDNQADFFTRWAGIFSSRKLSTSQQFPNGVLKSIGFNPEP